MSGALSASAGFELLAAIFDSLPFPAFAIDTKGQVIAWNRNMETLTGIKADDIMGKGNYEYSLRFYGLRRPMLIDMVDKPDQEIRLLFPTFSRFGHEISYEFDSKYDSGEPSYHRTTASPILGKEGTHFGYMQTIFDLTHEKQVEELLTRQKEALDTIIENAMVGVVVGERAGNVSYMNQRATEITGYTISDIPDQEAWFRMAFPDEQLRKAMIDDWESQATATGQARKTTKILTKDGKEKYIDFHGVLLKDGSTITTMWDITREKETEEILIKQREALDGILENNPVGTAVIDAEGKITFINHRIKEITGYSQEEIKTEADWFKLVYPDSKYRSEVLTYWRRQLDSHGRAKGTARIIHKDGSKRYLEFQAVKLTDGTTINSLWDLTRQKEIEQALIQEKEALHVAMEKNPAGSALINQKDEAVYANDRAVEMTGHTIEEIPTLREWLQLAYHEHDDADSVIDDFYRRLKAEGVASGSGSIVHGDGPIRYVDFQAVNLPDGRKLISIWDITPLKQIQQELVRQKETQTLILETSPTGIIMYDENKQVVYLNNRTTEITGYGTDELNISADLLRLLTPDDESRYQLQSQWAGQLQETGQASGTTRIINRHGVSKYVDFKTVRLSDGRMINYIRDVTHQYELEEALRASEAKFKALSDASLEGVVFIQDGISVEANQRAAEILGYDYNDLIGLSAFDIISPQSFKDYQQDKEAPFLVPIEITARSKTGSMIPLEIQVRMFEYKGKEVHAVSMLDLSERKKAEKMIEMQHSHLTSLFDSSPDALVLITFDEAIVDINPQFTSLFGYTKEECLGRRLQDLILLEHLAPEYSYIIVDQPLVHPLSIETVRKHKNGQSIDVMVKIVPVKNYGSYVMYSDISDRKRIEKTIQIQMQELESKNAEMERFTYTVSHDLRSPLITIQGFSSLLVEDIKNGEYQRLESDLSRIISASSKMDQLLQDLLELSRIGRMVNPPVEFAMSTVVDEVLELLHGPISSKNVRMVINNDFPVVQGDRSRIREVLQNLIENAIKFMGDQNEPTIQLGHFIRDNEFVFTVKDNGMGIEKRYLEKVFGLFEQLNAGYEGTGIGLALVKRIIEFHGGRIWVESDGPGKGSTFFFTLPVKTGKEDQQC